MTSSDRDKVVEWIEETEGNHRDVILDGRDGLHCSNCGLSGEQVDALLNNPAIPRVICWDCFGREMLE